MSESNNKMVSDIIDKYRPKRKRDNQMSELRINLVGTHEIRENTNCLKDNWQNTNWLKDILKNFNCIERTFLIFLIIFLIMSIIMTIPFALSETLFKITINDTDITYGIFSICNENICQIIDSSNMIEITNLNYLRISFGLSILSTIGMCLTILTQFVCKLKHTLMIASICTILNYITLILTTYGTKINIDEHVYYSSIYTGFATIILMVICSTFYTILLVCIEKKII